MYTIFNSIAYTDKLNKNTNVRFNKNIMGDDKYWNYDMLFFSLFFFIIISFLIPNIILMSISISWLNVFIRAVTEELEHVPY